MFVYIIIFYVLSLRFLREVAELASCDGPQTCEFVYKNVYKTEKKTSCESSTQGKGRPETLVRNRQGNQTVLFVFMLANYAERTEMSAVLRCRLSATVACSLLHTVQRLVFDKNSLTGYLVWSGGDTLPGGLQGALPCYRG